MEIVCMGIPFDYEASFLTLLSYHFDGGGRAVHSV